MTAGPNATGTEFHEGFRSASPTDSNRTSTATSGFVDNASGHVAVTSSVADFPSTVVEPCTARLDFASSVEIAASAAVSAGIPVRVTGIVADPAAARALSSALAAA